MAPAVRIALFSGPRVEIDGRDITRDLPGRQGRTLLAYLAARWPDAVSRDTLIAVVWPERAPSDPANDFRALLAKLRRALWEDAIVGRDLLSLNLPEDAWLDVRDVTTDAEALARPFLPGLQGDWIEELKRGIEDRRRQALEVLARDRSDLAQAERAAAALVAQDRFREGGYELLMEIQAGRGDVATALRTFDELRVLLREELGTAPSPGVLALHQRLLNGDVRASSLPAALEREARGPFVGRAAPLQRLQACWKRAAAGERQFVVVTGEPGIGKTRLASELARALHAAGATVLYGRSDPGSFVPYQPLIGALGPYVAARADALRARLEPELRELGRFLPGLHPTAPPGDDPQAQRYRLHEALARVLAAAAPVALLLDDLHWADTASLLALAHVLGHEEPASVLVVALARDDESNENLAELLARWQFERIALGGLDARETGEIAGDAVDPAALHERTGGNPLFIRELAAGGYELGETIKTTIGRRLARLGEPAGWALELAAVQGREFSFELLEAVLDHDPDELLRGVEAAVDAGLVRELDGGFAFSHALVQEALYENQSLLRRRRAHAQVGAALAARGERPAEVARHLYLARDPESARYSVLAAREATAALAYEEAVAHYRRALEAGEDVELLLALAAAEDAAADPAARATYARAADLARGDDAQFARAVLGRAHPNFLVGAVDAEAVALLEEALARFGEREDVLAVQLRARLASALHFHDAERAAALTAETVAMARRVREPAALLSVLEATSPVSADLADARETLALADELLAHARRGGDRELEGRVQLRRMYDLLAGGEIAAARAAHADIARLGEELRHPTLNYMAARFDVMWAELEDRVADAWALNERAFALGRRVQGANAFPDYAAAQCVLLYRQGALGTQLEALTAAARQAPLPAFKAALCLAQAQAGELDAARAGLRALSELPHDVSWRATMALLAEACALVGDGERAGALYAELLPHRHHFVQVAQAASWGSAEYYLGLLAETQGDRDLALSHYELAAARNEAAGLRHRAERAARH